MLRELRWKRKGLYRLFFLFVFLPMLCVFPYIRAVNNPNEFVRVFTVMAMVEQHTFQADDQIATWGWVNDMAKVRGKDGKDHWFMVKGPAILYPGLPGYLVFSRVVAPILGKHYPGVSVRPRSTDEERRWWLQMATWSMRIFGTQIPCFLFLLWFERYLRHFTSDAALRCICVAAGALGTNFLAYVNMFASHSQYACVAFLAFALIEIEMRKGDIRRMSTWRAFLAGFCTSLCVALEYHALFMTIVMSIFAVGVFWNPLQLVKRLIPPLARSIPEGTSYSPRRVLAFGVGGILNVLHVMYFQWKAYGNPLTPGHQMLESAQFASEHKQGLWGILWPTWEHIAAISFPPSYGFFGMSPFMLIGLLGVPLLLVKPGKSGSQGNHVRIITLVWFLCCAACFGVNAGFIEWRAGWTIGPRYLVVCAPFFAFGSACALERFSKKSRARRMLARGVASGLALASVVSIGTVGITYDTLPPNIARPFAQFAWPLARAGVVPHHIGEWFGWSSTTFWYVVCAALLLAPMLPVLTASPGERTRDGIVKTIAFLFALAAGLVPAFLPSEDKTPLFIVHPSSAGLASGMEPAGRDRITRLREEADRYGARGKGPCLYYQIADLERTLAEDGPAARDEAKARTGLPRDRCPKLRF